MIEASTLMKVDFIDFEFVETYYLMKENYKPKIVEEWFRQGLKVVSPRAMDADKPSPFLELKLWRDPFEDPTHYFDHDKMILVQIVQMMPLRMNGYDNAKYVVHEMSVIVWECAEYWRPKNPFLGQHKAFRRPEQQLFIVLDRWVSKHVISVDKAGHFGMVFCPKMFQRMMQNSAELSRKLRDDLDWGLVINLGRTMQEISDNQDAYYRGQCLKSRVTDLIDIVLLKFLGLTKDERLRDIGLYVTDDLDKIKPPPLTTPVEDE